MKSILSELSLRTLVALMVGALVCAALALAVDEYLDRRLAVHQARLVVESNAVADVGLDAADNFLAERSLALAYLLENARTEDGWQTLIDKRRLRSDGSMGRLLERVFRTERDAERRHVDVVRTAWNQVRDYRPVLDQWLSGTGSGASVPGRWENVSNTLVSRLIDFVHAQTVRHADGEAEFERFSQLRYYSLMLRNLLSAESGVIATNFIAGERVRADDKALLEMSRALSFSTWNVVEQGIDQLGDARARELFGRIRKNFLDPLTVRQDEILLGTSSVVARQGNEDPMRDYAWLALRAADTMSELTAEVGRLTNDVANQRLEKAETRERQALTIIVLILAMTLLVAIMFFYRLGLPLQGIQQRLDGLLKKHFRASPGDHPAAAGDECARIAFALQLLEENFEARERADRVLRQQEQLSASILKALHHSVIVTDGRGLITLFSQGAEAMLGYSPQEVVGVQTPMLFHDPDEVRERAEDLAREQGVPATSGFAALVARTRITGRADEREWTYLRKDGSRLTVLLSVTVFSDDRDSLMCCCVATNITERSQMAAEMSRLANYDPLTQLPNRRLFQDRLRMSIVQARRANTRFGLLMIDLDSFKPVNDQYGHSVGDLLLTAVAGRMQKCLRESDTLARVGGDEFVAILPIIADDRDATSVAEKILKTLSSPFCLAAGELTVSISCSIGVVIYPEHGGNEDSLLKSADDAMYIAKGLGRARIHLAGGHKENEAPGAVSGRRDSVGPLVWRRSYECGEPEIDEGHQRLFMHCNAIIRAVANDSVLPEQLPELLESLLGVVATHFEQEEGVLARHSFKGLDAHAWKHQELLGRAQAMYQRAVAQDLPMIDVLSFLTRDVVAQHMLLDDHDFFGFLREIQRQAAEVTN